MWIFWNNSKSLAACICVSGGRSRNKPFMNEHSIDNLIQPFMNMVSKIFSSIPLTSPTYIWKSIRNVFEVMRSSNWKIGYYTRNCNIQNTTLCLGMSLQIDYCSNFLAEDVHFNDNKDDGIRKLKGLCHYSAIHLRY